MTIITSHDELVRRASALGLSLAAVARRTPVAESSLARWKSGKHEPRLRTLKKITAVIEQAEAAQQRAPAL